MGSLSDFWQTFAANSEQFNIPFERLTPVGMLNAVRSETNSRDFAQVFTRQNGKDRKAKFKYKQRRTRGVVKNTSAHGAPNYCSATQKPIYLESEIDVTRDNYVQFTIPYEDVRGYEEGFERVLNDEISAHINPVLEEMNAQLIALYEVARGEFFDGTTTPKAFQGFSDLSKFEINFAFEQGVYNEFRKVAYTGNKLTVGDALANAYWRTLARGTDNTVRGQLNSLDLVSGMQYYDDTMLDATIGGATSTSGNVLSWEPGSFQMLEWFKNVGDFRMMNGTHVRDTITLNLGGVVMAFDIYMTENFCDDDSSGLVVTIKKEWDTWAFPNDIYASDDDLEGTNGLFRFNITGTTP